MTRGFVSPDNPTRPPSHPRKARSGKGWLRISGVLSRASARSQPGRRLTRSPLSAPTPDRQNSATSNTDYRYRPVLLAILNVDPWSRRGSRVSSLTQTAVSQPKSLKIAALTTGTITVPNTVPNTGPKSRVKGLNRSRVAITMTSAARIPQAPIHPVIGPNARVAQLTVVPQSGSAFLSSW